MAVKTLYLLPDSAAATGSTGCAQVQDGGSAPGAADCTAGWTVQKASANSYKNFGRATKVNSFLASPVLPDGTITNNTVGNAFRTDALTGTFANTDWTFTFKVRATTANAQQDTVRVRVFKSTDPNGQTGLTELTAATQESNTVVNNVVAQTATITWSPGGTITLASEYVFFAVAMKTVVAGGSNSSDWLLRADSLITTPDFSVSGGAAVLEATPAAVATLTAALTTAISMAATPAAQAAVTAALTTAIRLAATPAAQAAVTAALTTAIRMAATPGAQATLTAALTTAIRLAATPAAQATLTAALTTSGFVWAASPAASAVLTASLTTAIRFAATPAAQATLAAALTTAIRMSASASAQATLTATLATPYRADRMLALFG